MFKKAKNAKNKYIKHPSERGSSMKNKAYGNIAPVLAELFLPFLLGAVLYYSIEILWRGYSHWSMAIVGGICFLLLYLVGRMFPNMPLLLYCIIGAILISSAELTAGELLNIRLGLDIWDYSELPLNFRGQICLLFSFLWSLLCVPAHLIARLMRTKIFGCSR